MIVGIKKKKKRGLDVRSAWQKRARGCVNRIRIVDYHDFWSRLEWSEACGVGKILASVQESTDVNSIGFSDFAYEWSRQGLQPSLHPSRLFLYFNARKFQFEHSKNPKSDPKNKHPKQQGTYIRLACKALEKVGVCPEGPGQREWDYDDAHLPPNPPQRF